MPEHERPKKAKKRRYVRQIGLLGTIPILIAVGPVIGFFIGGWLDEKLGTEPYLLVVFITLGFIASGKEIYRIIKRAEKDVDEE